MTKKEIIVKKYEFVENLENHEKEKKMNVKIKDLTKSQFGKICSEHKCFNCPLKAVGKNNLCGLQLLGIGIQNIVNFGEKEIEVDMPILDTEEKKYLEAVLRPFKDRVDAVGKHCYDNYYYVWFSLVPVGTTTLPFFSKTSKMYQGMELDRRYTLKELGLFDEE